MSQTPESILESPQPGKLKPTSGAERIEVLDSLRGFAILGILLVNMTYFFWPIYYLFDSRIPIGNGPLDYLAEAFVGLVAQGKFYTMFSLLFGLGMAVQYDRCVAKGRKFVPFFARRMFFLMIIGGVHAFLIWSGDILMNYAIFGFALLLLSKTPPKWLLVIAAACFTISLGIAGLSLLTAVLAQMMPEVEAVVRQQMATFRTMFDQAMTAYASGSPAAGIAQRARDMLTIMAMWPFGGWSILTSFVMGIWAWRKGIFQDPRGHGKLLRRVLIWGLLLGIPLNATYAYLKLTSGNMFAQSIGGLALTFGQFALCWAYIAGLTLLFERGRFRQLFDALAKVGRTALSNYLLHSLVFATIAYYFGLFAKPHPALCLLMAIGFYILQVFLSGWWLRHFRFGPAEWLWRSLTYGRLQPMRR